MRSIECSNDTMIHSMIDVNFGLRIATAEISPRKHEVQVGSASVDGRVSDCQSPPRARPWGVMGPGSGCIRPISLAAAERPLRKDR